MKPTRKLVPMKLLLAVLLVACWIPMVANAQTAAFEGKFQLQNEVRWGLAVLPAGEYSFTIDWTMDDKPLAVVRSTNGKKAVFALATATAGAEPGGSYIFIADEGTRRVRLLNLPEHNLSLAFGTLSKRDRQELHAAGTEVVPVLVAKK
jgi:hypothetical protein